MVRVPELYPFEIAVDENGDGYLVVDCPRCDRHTRYAMDLFKPGDVLSCPCGTVVATLSEENLEAVRTSLTGLLGSVEETR